MRYNDIAPKHTKGIYISFTFGWNDHSAILSLLQGVEQTSPQERMQTKRILQQHITDTGSFTPAPSTYPAIDYNPSYTSTAQTDSDGNATLTTPVSGGTVTVSVVNGTDTAVVIPGITIENDGSNMGTIALPSAGSYSLKVTGTIAEREKDDGYLYGNNYKAYPLTLTITNISNKASEPSVCTIAPADSRVTIALADGSSMSDGILISTLKPNLTKTLNLVVTCGALSDGYLDTGLLVEVKNAMTGQTWQDYVPLRFYKGLVPVTIAAKSVENNSSAALNGFIIYPDGNSQFFTVPQDGDKTMYVPSFGITKPYMLAFSGATVAGTLSSSTEMFYTVAIDTWTKQPIDKSSTAFIAAVQYGERGNRNETENTAFAAANTFQAYLADGDIDFFTFSAAGSNAVLPDFEQAYTITYVSDYGTAPALQTVPIGTTVAAATLPVLSADRYNFLGWYIGSYKIAADYVVTSNITLTAKWEQRIYDATSLATLDLSTLTEPYTLTIDGAISESTLKEVASLIANASDDVTLDLSETTGLTEITGITTPNPNYPNLNDYSSIFENCNHFKSIVLPNCLETLGDYAFWECYYLESVTLPENLTAIGRSVFVSCKNLKTLTIPDSVTSFGSMTFYGCSSLTEFTIPKGMTEIPSLAFAYCTSLENIVIPDYVTAIGDRAFEGCTALKSVSISNSVKSIEFAAFRDCTSLVKITIPASVTRIGTNCFYGCTNLTSITFDDTSTWYYTSSYYTGGIQISVTWPSTNARYFTSTYVDKRWYKE